MTRPDAPVLVAGATGQQGGAVVARLLADGWRVRALTRRPETDAAIALAAQGVEVIGGDFDDPASLRAAVEGVHGVFSMHPGGYLAGPYGQDPRHEVRSAANLAAAAAAAGVRHIVHTSALGAGGPLRDRLPIIRLKTEAEQEILAGSVSATVFRLASFMDNYFGPNRALQDGVLATALVETKREPLVALADVAHFAAMAFTDPDRFAGQTLELAGDELTQAEIAAAIGSVAGRIVPYVQIPMDTIRAISEEYADILSTLNAIHLPVDIQAVRAYHPGLLTFDAWLRGPAADALSAHFADLPPHATLTSQA